MDCIATQPQSGSLLGYKLITLLITYLLRPPALEVATHVQIWIVARTETLYNVWMCGNSPESPELRV